MIKRILISVFVLFMGLQVPAFAAINVVNRTGTIKITMPGGGAVITVNVGDPLSAIPDGASIEIVTGTAQFSATESSTVSVTAGGQTIQVTSGATVNVTMEASGASLVEVAAGNVTVQTSTGSTVTMNTGDQIRITTGGANGGVEVLKGEVTSTTTGGETTTLTAPLGEPYTPPAVQEPAALDTNVQNEEGSNDISPVK